jgi:N-acetylneuraminic acid mutarotase
MMKSSWLLFLALLSTGSLFAQAQWIQIDSMKGPAKSVTTSFVLGDTGYVLGGMVDNQFTRRMYSFKPNQNDWDDEASWGGDLGSGQNRGSAVSFVIGNKAYAGLGQGNTAGFYNDFWEYDPSTETWTQIADYEGNARRGAVGFVIDGKGYVGTGHTVTGLTNDFYSYDPVTNTWSSIAPFPGTPRKYAVSFTIGNFGFVGLGDDGVYKNDLWMYIPEFDVWTARAPLPSLGRVGSSACSIYPDGFVFTGETPSGYTSETWQYHYFSNSWEQTTDFPGIARKHSTAFAINGIAYVGSGYGDMVFMDDFYALTPVLSLTENQVIQLKCYPNPTTEIISVANEQLSACAIFDLNGRNVPVKWVLEGRVINVCDLESGSYILFGKTTGGASFTSQFIKQ